MNLIKMRPISVTFNNLNFKALSPSFHFNSTYIYAFALCASLLYSLVSLFKYNVKMVELQ